MSIKPNIVIIGRVERETTGVKSNHKDVVAYARGLIDKHFVAKEESFYIVKPYGDYYYYEIHDGGEGRAYLPSVMRMLDVIDKNELEKNEKTSGKDADAFITENDAGSRKSSGAAWRIKEFFSKKGSLRSSDDVKVDGCVIGVEDNDLCGNTLYIKGAIKCSKIKFNGNNMVFSFTSESENDNIKTTNGISQSISMTPYFSDFGNVKSVAYAFLLASVLFFVTTVVFRELGFRERFFYIKGAQVLNVSQFIEKTIKNAGIADGEYVEKVVFFNGKWVVKKKKISNYDNTETVNEMIRNKELLKDGVDAVRKKTLR